MKQRVADYIADFLVEHGIRHCFSVVGGGAMHLNDALGHHDKLEVIYDHHEQACSMAAEAYARVNNQIAVVCVTSGPGATNAITGVACGWMASIPMLILSGQVRYETTVYASGLDLRTKGFQEFDIMGSVHNMTKYCQLIRDPEDVRYCLEKALFLAHEGRPGPCWLDIPMDVQGALIDPGSLRSFSPSRKEYDADPADIDLIIKKISEAKRPVLYIGNGVRFAGAHKEMLELVDLFNIPVVTGDASVDAIETSHPLFVGMTGTRGGRAANFAVQNSDLFISFGGRLGYMQTGFNYKAWARDAYKIINDIDINEIKKDNIGADFMLCCDAGKAIRRFIEALPAPLPENKEWIRRCTQWKTRYPAVLSKHYEDSKPNVYAFFKELTERLSCDDQMVVSVGAARVAGSQAAIIKEGMRFITNAATGSMGYDLPAALGVCFATDRKKTILVTGDGSLQMNIQEFQTIVHHRLPIIIFILNNGGYNAIRATQTSFFSRSLVGVGPESGDLSFPDLSKLVPAYGIDYRRCESMDKMVDCITWALEHQEPCLCELMLSAKQGIEPKVASKKRSDGTMVSGTLEDMAPFLSSEELAENMLIPMIKESV